MWTELSAIVGAEHVRDCGERVDGVAVSKLVEPGTAEELAAVLKKATAAGLALIPRGGGTKMEWGNPPRRSDAILSIARLNQIEEHAWADMTATVAAGCTVKQVQEVLAQRGQRIAMDPLWPERATIGGVLASNDTGAIRLRFGGLRDLIIGATIALPDGTLAKSGGKVVKNVAGYDLMKLVTGSLGTLGVITRAIFRLHPVFKQTQTVSFAAGSHADANRIVLAVNDSNLVPTGLQVVSQSDGEVRVDIRFEGIPAGIEAQAAELAKFVAGARQAPTPEDAWRRETLWEGAAPAMVGKFSILPEQIASYCEHVHSTCGGAGAGWKVVAHGTGLGWVRVEANAPSLAAIVNALRARAEQGAGSFVVLHCPPELKQQLDMWGSVGDGLPLMGRIKNQFDPTGALNPGRFVGRI